MDTNSIWSLSGAEHHLQAACPNTNILEEIKETIYSWKYRSEYDLDSIKSDLAEIVQDISSCKFKNKTDKETVKSLNCVVYNEIYENLVPLIRGNFSKEDLYLYEKCTYLCKKNITPGQFGSSVYNCLPFIAAVVELSVLDNYKSPLEKINCLCSTYDLIFAELKMALVSIISKYSERECDIPVINNEEIIPILMVVIIKSKLLYLWSNLFYIQFFGSGILEENTNARSIFQAYETAVYRIMATQENCLTANCEKEKMPANLDVAETMTIFSEEENNTSSQCQVTLKDERKRRIISLIAKSTAEKNFIPLDVAKIFT